MTPRRFLGTLTIDRGTTKPMYDESHTGLGIRRPRLDRSAHICETPFADRSVMVIGVKIMRRMHRDARLNAPVLHPCMRSRGRLQTWFVSGCT